MRSPTGRRYRSLFLELVGEYGEAELTRISELAGLKLTLERTQAETINGADWRALRAREDLVRISNLIARREGELRSRRAAASAPRPSLHDRLARRAAERASCTEP